MAAGTQTAPAQAVSGTIAAVTQTTPGALATTTAHNAAFAGIDNLTTGTPETAALSWLVTFWYQGLKHNPHIHQNNHKWFLLPLMAIIVGFFVFSILAHDPLIGIARAIQNAGLMAVNAMANYHSAKPLGWFTPAAEMGG